VIFSGRSSRLYSVDIEAGKRNWVYKSPTDQWLVGGPVISESIIYLGSSDQHLFRAFDANKGTLKWETKLDCRIWGRACILDDKIYIGSNSLYVIDKKTGSILKQYTFAKVHEDKKYGKYIDRTANIHSSPIIFEDKVIFGSDDGRCLCIEVQIAVFKLIKGFCYNCMEKQINLLLLYFYKHPKIFL
jgi:outer membrane protein assembly factor BamB